MENLKNKKKNMVIPQYIFVGKTCHMSRKFLLIAHKNTLNTLTGSKTACISYSAGLNVL